MKGFYSDLTSRFKIGSFYGKEWKRTNSVAQGCPLSVMWANMIGAAWVKVMNIEAPRVGKNVFIDDKSLRARNREDFENAFNITDAFDLLCGQKLNMAKVVAFATELKDRTWLKEWEFKGQKVKEVREAVTLGHELSVNKRALHKKQRQRIETSQETIERIQKMSAPPDAKRKMIEGKAVPQAVAGSAIALLPKTSADMLARQSLIAAWGRTFMMRAPEAAHAVVLDPVRHHPFWASINECIGCIARTFQKRPMWRSSSKGSASSAPSQLMSSGKAQLQRFPRQPKP
jgi:hypothetical protein